MQTREYVQTYNLSYAKKSYFTPHSFWVKFVGKAKFEKDVHAQKMSDQKLLISYAVSCRVIG